MGSKKERNRVRNHVKIQRRRSAPPTKWGRTALRRRLEEAWIATLPWLFYCSAVALIAYALLVPMTGDKLVMKFVGAGVCAALGHVTTLLRSAFEKAHYHNRASRRAQAGGHAYVTMRVRSGRYGGS